MVRFIAVDKPAAEEIVSDRFMQSVDYENGRTLASLLQNTMLDVRVGPRLRISRLADGLFLVGVPGSSPDYVVFDLHTSGLFSGTHPPADSLLYFQKVLRFAIKTWGNLRLSISERPLVGSTKVVVFPYPISQHTSFRISIELAPDHKRQVKRAAQGRSMLVYRSGTDEGGGPQEEVQLTSFRKFLEATRLLKPVLPEPGSPSTSKITALKVTSLDAPPSHLINPFQGFDRWLELLTDSQKSFVLSELLAPHRIEGPAGTGKTLCLVLKAINELRTAAQDGREDRALFITHSEATRRTIQQLVETNDSGDFVVADVQRLQHLKLATLQQLCGELLQREIHESEFLDRDAMESKQLQVLYVDEALSSAMKDDYPTHQHFLSPHFESFLTTTERWLVAEMVQHEISVVIKGRADEQLENYRKLPRLKYGLPTETSRDRGFVWGVFRRYQAQLQASAQFDTDDIVLTTIGQLDTPIWRRRRGREGYDSIYIDETHLFNINELSLFHYLSKSSARFPIAYSVDRSQAVGDRGWTDELFENTLSPDPDSREKAARTEVRGIFRCSPEIVNLAFSVTSAGATLFTNFDDPLKLASSMFTAEEERKCSPPVFITCSTDDEMVTEAFRQAERLIKELGVSRSDVALVAFSDELFRKSQAYATAHNKPVELLKQRGDLELVQRAQASKRFVLSSPEYVGGLDFDGVILIGVDDGRVPPSRTLDSTDSANFLSYASHNRLYVAITRARYCVEILVSKDRGPSPLLRSAIESGVLREEHP